MSGMDEDLGKAWRDGCWETAAAHFDEAARELERHGHVPVGTLTGMSPSAREGMLETMVAHAEFEVLNERTFGDKPKGVNDATVRELASILWRRIRPGRGAGLRLRGRMLRGALPARSRLPDRLRAMPDGE